MKKVLLWFLLAILSFSAFGVQAEERETVELTDFAQRTVQAPLHPQCVVALSASIAEAWLQAGGALRRQRTAWGRPLKSPEFTFGDLSQITGPPLNGTFSGAALCRLRIEF